MYSGSAFKNRLHERIRTGVDMQGLNIWQAIWQGDGYIGEENNNKIHE